MADFRVISNGNLSDYATRLYNITLGANATALPTVGDNIYANGFTLQINVSCDLGGGKWSTEANAGLGVAAGGGFNVSVTNLQIVGDRVAGSSACHSQTTNGLDIFWNGDIIGGIESSSRGCYNNSSSTINNTAINITGGQDTGTQGCLNNSSGVINNTCTTISAGSSGTSQGAHQQGTGTTNINCTTIKGATSGSYGCYCNANGTINITAVSIEGGAVGGGVLNNSTGTINIDCPTIKSGTAESVYGVSNTGNGTMTVVNCNEAISVLYSAPAIYNLSNTPIVLDNVQIIGGISVAGNVIIANSITMPKNTLMEIETFSWQGITDLDEKDVRKGVSFNFGTKEGELEVPPKEAVSMGTPVDDTVGEAILTIITD